jgi:hypothetical protein
LRQTLTTAAGFHAALRALVRTTLG